jgi:SAM-dependent methyltransferase
VVTSNDIVDHFQRTWKEYDEWYKAHPALFRTELAALRKAVPARGRGLEIGVGTGQFAAALSIPYGLDPSSGMLGPARRKGIQVVQGFGEAQPFRAGSFDYAIAVFVIEFVDDLRGFLAEAGRILRTGGVLITGIIDRDSAWGRHFHSSSQAGRFFHPPSPRELLDCLEGLGLEPRGAWQALFGPPPDLEEEEEPRTGFGQGGFVVLKAIKTG